MTTRETTSMEDIFRKDLVGEMVFPRRAGLRNVDYRHFRHHQDRYGNEYGLPHPGRSTRIYGPDSRQTARKEYDGYCRPLYIDYGKPVTIGKGCFIQQCCTFFGRGGITIGDGVFIGPKVNLITITTTRTRKTAARPMAVRS